MVQGGYLSLSPNHYNANNIIVTYFIGGPAWGPEYNILLAMPQCWQRMETIYVLKVNILAFQKKW